MDKHQIFVSYARVDDLPQADYVGGWVIHLIRELERRLSGRLGRQGFVNFKIDLQLNGDDEIDDQLKSAIRDSSIFLAIASAGFLESDWCTNRELPQFLEESCRERIIVVEKMPFDRNRLPEPMQKRIARKFWEEDAVKGEWRTFGEPVSTSLSDVRYHEVLNGLSQEMADLLLSLPKEKQQRLEPEQRQREEQEWLEVERRKQKARSASPGEIGINDVFIAFKHLDEKGARTRDSKIASNVYEFLTAKGLKVFFSEVTLEDLGISAYKKAIDKALDSATVLVAIGTSRPRLDSEWVRYEWDSFYNDILTGIKPNGSVFTYINGMTTMELPRALRQTQTCCA